MFHLGRTAGYAALGALAAVAMDNLAWVTQQSVALQPVWTLMHVAAMAWGLLMVLQAQQPVWVERAGRAVWGRVRFMAGTPGQVATAGALWALMPCGLLYSAVLVAALSGTAVHGAATMAFFAMGSGAWLMAGPWLWDQLRGSIHRLRAQWGTRIAGGLLCAMAGWALWMDLIYKPSLWCR